MSSVAIVYHSGTGHTALAASEIEAGVASAGGSAQRVTVEEAAASMAALDEAAAIVFGCPTHMGGPSAAFKALMDATSSRWGRQMWRDKIAAGFTCGGALSGDQMTTLIALATFAAQHGMMWIGQAELGPKRRGEFGGRPEDVNRVGSHLGLMIQGDGGESARISSGDAETARRFGARIASAAARWDVGGGGGADSSS